MDYVKVAKLEELPPNTMKMVVVEGNEVLLTNVDDACYAISNKCPHLGGSLVKGKLEGSIVTCHRHKAQFDVKTGQAVREAKIGFIKMKVKDDAVYRVKVEGAEVFIAIS